MQFVSRGKTNLKYILIVIVLAVIVGGGILGYQYLWKAEKETTPPEVKAPENGSLEEATPTKPDLNLKTTKLATIPEEYYITEGPLFSYDGKNVAYVAREKKKNFVIINDRKIENSERCGYIEGLTFSLDNKYLAYSCSIDFEGTPPTEEMPGEPEVHIVGKSVYNIKSHDETFYGPDFSKGSIDNFVFNPKDSEEVTYIRMQGSALPSVITSRGGLDVKERDSYSFIYDISYSPDGKNLLYVGEEQQEVFIIINEQKGKSYDEIVAPVFSPNNKRVAYTARRGLEVFVVVDDKEGKAYYFVGYITFSPDSNRLAYVARNEEGYFVVDGDKESKAYEFVWQPAFSPNSKRFAYTVGKSGEFKHIPDKFFVVLDNEERKIYDGKVSDIIFSPDSSLLAYVARNKIGEVFVVAGNKEGEFYDDIWSPVFSPDGKYIAYGARDGSEIWWIVTPVLAADIQVNIQVNESNTPPKISYNSIFTATWVSAGAYSCAGFGHHIPLVEPVADQSLWTDLINLPASGEIKLYARHQNWGYISPIEIGIQCRNLSGQQISDEISIQVIRPPTD